MGGSPTAQGGGVATGGGFSPSKSWLEMSYGGRVPGPIGTPHRAVVHGGEIILPSEVSVGLYNLLSQLGRGRDLDTRGMR